MNRAFKVARKRLLYLLVTLFLLGLAWLLYFKVYGNFHQVDSNLYRSAQLYSFNLPYYIKHYRIRSIINLRGPSKSSWYKDELAISKHYGVAHYDFGFSDRKVQPIKKMQELIALMQAAPKPLLLHCKAGADRTSLASALYLYAIKHDKDAAREISILYGHFPWLGSKTKAMDISFEHYQKSAQALQERVQ